MTISRRLARSFRWSGLATAGLAVLAYLQLAILVRWLEVADFAGFALAAVFINLGFQLQEGGLNAFVLQERFVSPVQLSTLFWLNLLFSGLLWLLSLPLAGALADFYQMPALATTLGYLALLFPCNAFRLQYKTLLQKQLRFKALSLSEGAAAVAGMLAAVSLAFYGWGVLSLAGGYGMRVLVEAALYYYHGRRDFRPAFAFDHRGLQLPLRLASGHWLERLVTHFVYQLDVLLIGKWLGPDLLGVYEVFKRVLMRPANLLASATERVAWPVMSRLAGRATRLQAFYEQTVNAMLSGLLLVYLPVFFVAEWLVSWYFGLQWSEYLPVFRTMILLTVLLSAIQLTDSFLLVNHKIHWWAIAGLLLGLLWTAAIAAARASGLPGSIQYLTAVQAFFTLILVPLLIGRAGRQPVRYAYFLRPLGIASLAAAGAVCSSIFLAAEGLRPFVALSVFLVLYSLLQYYFNRKIVYLILGLLPGMRQSGF